MTATVPQLTAEPLTIDQLTQPKPAAIDLACA